MANSHNLLQDFLILPDLVLNVTSHRAREIGTKINRDQTFSSKFWLCAVMAARRFGLYPSFACFWFLWVNNDNRFP